MDLAEVTAILSLATSGAVIVPVFAQPRASRSKVVGVHDGMVKVALAAPPVEGAANKALLKFIAKVLGVSKRDVALVAGATGRRKRIEVTGATLEEVAAQLAAS